MKFQFFTIPVHDSQAVADEMNAFLAAHRVISVERQFVSDGASSLWSVCVSYLEGEGRPRAERRAKRIDYREVLSPEDFAVFSKLRQLRKELAERDGVPVYAVFTNDQLAEMVREQVDSIARINQIDGVGQSRLQKYGEAFLHLLKQDRPAVSPAERGSEGTHETNGHRS